jgi:hypothetical protein
MATAHDISGVPESALPLGLAQRLAADVPPAPWNAVLDAVIWMHPATAAAAEQLPAALRGRRAMPWTVGAAIRYAETPVGAYDEVLASPVVLVEWPLPAAVVAFIAVDSLASIAGGRRNWALPKTLGRFTWSRPSSMHAEGDGDGTPWSVDVAVRARPRAVAIRVPARARQAFADGATRAVPIVVAGQVRIASVDVATRGPTLPAWLLAGRHPGLVLTGARARFGVPR